MYEIERKDKKLIVRGPTGTILSASEESWVVYKQADEMKVSKLKDLSDQELILALATRVDLAGPPSR